MYYWTKTTIKKKITCDMKKYVPFLLINVHAICELRF